LALLIGGGSFLGGMAFQRAQQASIQARFFAGRGGQPGSDAVQGGGGFPGGGLGGFAFGQASGAGTQGVFGTVKSLEGDTMTVSTAQDVTTVKLTDQTTIEQLVAADRSLLAVGQQITVRGTRDDSGTVTAVSIQILGEAPAQ
jgi:hypothetical protein